MTLIGSTITSEQVGQSNSPSENYLFLNVMVNFVIVNQKMTGSALHIEKNQTITRKSKVIFLLSITMQVCIPDSANAGGLTTLKPVMGCELTFA